jgi:chromosome segregation ATPase
MVMSAFEQWEQGDLEDVAALRALCNDLGEIESELQPLEAQRKQMREQIERITRRLDGQRAEIKGFGLVAVTSGGTRVSWDGKALDSLLAKLAANGYPQIAEELAAARRETATAATLRITRAKSEAAPPASE